MGLSPDNARGGGSLRMMHVAPIAVVGGADAAARHDRGAAAADCRLRADAIEERYQSHRAHDEGGQQGDLRGRHIDDGCRDRGARHVGRRSPNLS